jgi:hypothetical protein
MRLPLLGSPRSTSPNHSRAVLWAGCTITLVASLLSAGSQAQAASARRIGEPVAVAGAAVYAQYDQRPNTPTTLTTSRATTCTGTITTVGDGDVSLYAVVSDPDGDQVGATFSVSKASTDRVIATGTTTPLSSGSTAMYIVPRSILDGAARGAVTKISWKVRVTDFKRNSAWSTTCSFKFDPTHPGAPTIVDPGGEIIGTPATFTIIPPATGTAPTSYRYQLNAGAPVSVTVVNGTTTQFSLTPTAFTNTLTVYGLSADGNVGDSANLTFNAQAAPTAADSDLTGDGIPDLLDVGGVNGLPSGLWLAKGQASTGHTTGDGQVIVPATDIGVNGSGLGTVGAPADFDSSLAITGHFTGGSFQDVLIYWPTGNNAGGGAILNGTGDGSPLPTQQSGNEHSIVGGTFTDANGDNPLQIANAGNTSHRDSAYPDLIAVNGDATNGYYLDYYPSIFNTPPTTSPPR